MIKKIKAFNEKEFKIFKKLDSSLKIQDFINGIPINFQITCRSPLMVLKSKKANCIEGAFLAAAIFWSQGKKPVLLDLRTVVHDYDHVVALFKERGYWGAISKTNHPVLRYREPIYKSVRELALSYFHEYFLDSGEKTLRDYSKPFSLIKFGEKWLTSEKNLWSIAEALDQSRHCKILNKRMIRRLRPADKIEIKATKTTQWKR